MYLHSFSINLLMFVFWIKSPGWSSSNSKCKGDMAVSYTILGVLPVKLKLAMSLK